MQEITNFSIDNTIAESLELVKAIFQENLTKKQLDIILYVVSLVKREDEKFYTYVIPLENIQKVVCPENPRKEQAKDIIKKSIKSIMNSSFCILGDETESYYHWIQFAKLDWKKKTLTIKLSEEVAEFYLNINENVLIYNLKCILALSTKTQARLYQWAYSKTGFGNKIPISIEDAKQLFYGPKEIRTSEFVRKYLEPAIKAINEKTDLEISYEKVKADKKNTQKVTSLNFEVISKYQKPEKKKQKTRTKSQRKSDSKKIKDMFKENAMLKNENDRLTQENLAYTERIYILEEREKSKTEQ